MSELDKDFKPIPVEDTVSYFEELHTIFMKRSDKVMEQYLGCDRRLVQLGMNALDEIAYAAARWIEEANAGSWPREVLSVLGRTMKSLVEKKEKLCASAEDVKAVPVLDLIGMEHPKHDGLLN